MNRKENAKLLNHLFQVSSYIMLFGATLVISGIVLYNLTRNKPNPHQRIQLK